MKLVPLGLQTRWQIILGTIYTGYFRHLEKTENNIVMPHLNSVRALHGLILCSGNWFKSSYDFRSKRRIIIIMLSYLQRLSFCALQGHPSSLQADIIIFLLAFLIL